MTQAERLQQEALEIWQQQGQELHIADATRHLGQVVVAIGERRHSEAGQYFRQALEPSIADAAGYPFQQAERSPKRQLLDYFREKQMLWC